MRRSVVLLALVVVAALRPSIGRAEPPRISNVQVSDNPITIGEFFTVSFDFEGALDRYVVENTWETKDGEVKKEVKDYAIKPEAKEKPKGVISFRWKSDNAAAKPYRILKIWVKDAAGNQSNALSLEVTVARGPVEEDVRIPMTERSLFGSRTVNLSATIVRPEGDGVFPLLLLNHGTPRSPQERAAVTAYKEQARHFARRGFAVVAPLRRGYGTSEGDYAESSGKCDDANYDYVASEMVKDLRAAVDFMRRKPYVDARARILLVGQSAGGFASLAYAAAHPDEVAAVVNFAGGRGSTAPYKVCSESRLVTTMSSFGRTARMPTLWIYTEQDDFFPPSISRSMFEGYRSNGGQGKLVILSSEFGHNFFRRAPRTWEPLVDDFLREVGPPK